MMIPAASATTAINATGIQRGDKTHHQDQSILFVNFNTTNTTNRIVGNDVVCFLFSIVRGLGFEPRLRDSKSLVLPITQSPIVT